jgi:hypothetical protein
MRNRRVSAGPCLAISVALFASYCGPSQLERHFFVELRRTENELSVPHRINRVREIEEYRQTIALGERVLGRNHPALVPPLMRIGQYDRVLIIHAAHPALTRSTWRRYARAANLFGRPLFRHEAVQMYLISRAVALNGLAAVAERGGRFDLAGKLYGEALKVLLRQGSRDLDSQFRLVRHSCLQRRDWQCVERITRRLETRRASTAGA